MKQRWNNNLFYIYYVGTSDKWTKCDSIYTDFEINSKLQVQFPITNGKKEIHSRFFDWLLSLLNQPVAWLDNLAANTVIMGTDNYSHYSESQWSKTDTFLFSLLQSILKILKRFVRALYWEWERKPTGITFRVDRSERVNESWPKRHQLIWN